MNNCLFCFCLLSTSFSAFSQQNRITGKIRSAEDSTLLNGVSVSVKGTRVGVTSDKDGAFNINAKGGSTLVFSYIGYNDKEVEVGSGNYMSVRLSAGNNNLNTVVVIGYGTQK